MSTLTTYASAAARDSASPASSNTGLCIFRSDTKAIEVSDGAVYRAFNNDGVYSQVANFDGAGDYIDTNEKFDFIQKTCDFTVTFWMKFADYASTAANQYIIHSSDSNGRVGFMFYYDNRASSGSNKKLITIVSTTTGVETPITVTNGITDNNWHHIAVTGSGSGGTLRLYKDGSEIGSTTAPTAGSTSAMQTLTFGGALNTSGNLVNPFGGYLDEVAIFDSELSSTEISNLVSSHNYTGATSLYKFEGNADDSIGTNDGTNNGATFEGALVAL